MSSENTVPSLSSEELNQMLTLFGNSVPILTNSGNLNLEALTPLDFVQSTPSNSKNLSNSDELNNVSNTQSYSITTPVGNRSNSFASASSAFNEMPDPKDNCISKSSLKITSNGGSNAGNVVSPYISYTAQSQSTVTSCPMELSFAYYSSDFPSSSDQTDMSILHSGDDWRTLLQSQQLALPKIQSQYHQVQSQPPSKKHRTYRQDVSHSFSPDSSKSLTQSFPGTCFSSSPNDWKLPYPLPEQEQQYQISQPTPLLNKFQALMEVQNDHLANIKEMQKQFLSGKFSEENLQRLRIEQQQLLSEIDSKLKILKDLHQNCILLPPDIRKVFYLQQQLEAQNMQLRLYEQELTQATVSSTLPKRCFVSLLIVQQPFPMVLTKSKSLEEPVTVKLITGANYTIQYASPVRVHVFMDSPHPKGTSSKHLDNDTEFLNELLCTSEFHLKFLNGTRKNLATLKFSIQVKLTNGETLNVESCPSRPFVTITNECQYEESDRLLLKTDAFGERDDTTVSWPHLANLLQRHFLRASRQDSVKPRRFLSKLELSYLNQKFFGGQMSVTPQMFDDFWAWFGKGLHKIRYGRHLCSMWQAGLIYGFVSREDVNSALVNQETGTFLIRLSERHAGSFAIGYVIDEPNPQLRVRHYLIKPEDMFGTAKTLPDFLMESNQFSRFLQVSYDLQTGIARHRIIHKELALEPYDTKTHSLDATVNGYDDALIGKKTSEAKSEMIVNGGDPIDIDFNMMHSL